MLSYENKNLCRPEIEGQEFLSNMSFSEKRMTKNEGFMWK